MPAPSKMATAKRSINVIFDLSFSLKPDVVPLLLSPPSALPLKSHRSNSNYNCNEDSTNPRNMSHSNTHVSFEHHTVRFAYFVISTSNYKKIVQNDLNPD